MIPASDIGKHNYDILGNQRVGETHASRMKRVNTSQMQPMGLAVVPDGGAALDAAFYGVGGGFIGALLIEKGRSTPSTKNSRMAGALVGSGLGAAASLLANAKNNQNEAGSFGSDPVIETGAFRIAALGTLTLVGLAASGIGGLDWEGMQRVNPWTWKNLGTLAGVGLAGSGVAISLGASPNTMTALTVGGGAAVGGAYLAHRLGDAVEG